MKQLAVIGSTGSIGQNTLKVVAHLKERLEVFALGVRSSVDSLALQVGEFNPRVVAIGDARHVDAFTLACRQEGVRVPEIVTGQQGLCQIASAAEVDTVVAAAVGAAGLAPTHAAVRAGKTVALANKEAMVLAGELIRPAARRSGSAIIPIDSEHSAVDQCLRSGAPHEVRRLILTASGGPFRDTPAERFAAITPREALNHPTWRMGRRITVDSATLMNKGLEVIEARWLFEIPAKSIDIVIHPQSIVHSMVEFVDGSIVAQLGTTDMRQPIQYALTYPERVASELPPLDLQAMSRLDFSQPDRLKFPCVGLAYAALEAGGTMPAVLNAADEIAVEAFLNERIRFSDISEVLQRTLEAHRQRPADSLECIFEADRWARLHAEALLTSVLE